MTEYSHKWQDAISCEPLWYLRIDIVGETNLTIVGVQSRPPRPEQIDKGNSLWLPYNGEFHLLLENPHPWVPTEIEGETTEDILRQTSKAIQRWKEGKEL